MVSPEGLETMVPRECYPSPLCLQRLFPRLKGAAVGRFSSSFLGTGLRAQQPVPLAMATSCFAVCSDGGRVKPLRQRGGTDFRRRAEQKGRGVLSTQCHVHKPFSLRLCVPWGKKKKKTSPKRDKASSIAPCGASLNHCF